MAKKSKTTAIVIGVVAVAAVGGLAYWWYKKNKNGATKSAATAPTTQVPVIVIPTSTTTGTVSGAAAVTQKTTALTPATPIAAVQGEARPITGVSSLPTITIPSVGTLGPQLQLVPATTSGGEYQLVYKTKTGRMVVGEVGQY